MLSIANQVRSTTIYVLKKFIIFCVIVLIAILGFNIAFNQARVRVFVNDAFTARANAILEDTGGSGLDKYFSEEFLTADSIVTDSPYALYEVSRYDYKLDITHISVGWIAPTKAKVTFNEYVDEIRGQFKGTSEEKIGMPDTPPEWTPARYKITLKKSEGKWYITEIEKVKDLKK